MKEYNKSSKLGIIVTIIILVIIVFISNKEIDKTNYIENVVNSIVMPIQNSLAYLKNKINKNTVFFADVETLKEENAKLKEELKELENIKSEYEIIKAENNTLKESNELKEKYGNYSTVAANIINKDITNFSEIFVINVGEADGVKVNMTVIADKGLVGHVISVTKNTAKVQTIIDTANTLSATLTTSKESILVRGYLTNEGYMLKATYIPIDAELIENDSIETSGLGGIYQRGIHIGTVKSIVTTKNKTDRYAIINPAVDFKKLDTVLVITQ